MRNVKKENMILKIPSVKKIVNVTCLDLSQRLVRILEIVHVKKILLGINVINAKLNIGISLLVKVFK